MCIDAQGEVPLAALLAVLAPLLLIEAVKVLIENRSMRRGPAFRAIPWIDWGGMGVRRFPAAERRGAGMNALEMRAARAQGMSSAQSYRGVKYSVAACAGPLSGMGPRDGWPGMVPIVAEAVALVAAAIVWLGYRRMSARVGGRKTHGMDGPELDNRQLQTIVDSMSDALVVLDRERSVVLINRAASRMLGLRIGYVEISESMQSFDYLGEDESPLTQQEWPGARAWRGEFVQNLELGIRRRDTGAVLVAEISTAPVKNEAGEMILVVVSYHDVSKKKQMAEMRSKLAAIVESCEDAIIGKDLRGVVTCWNKGAEKIFGYSAAEMIGMPIQRLLPEGREQEVEVILSRIERGETVDHFETIRRRSDGELIDVSLTISPIRDGSGRVIGASKIARNISERKQLERQLQQSQKLEAIGQLTGGIAHDFNNLLGVIIGNLELLERQLEGDEAAMKRLATSQRAALRGAELTRRLLAFSSREELTPAATRLDESIQNTVDLASRALGPEISIATHFDGAVPPVFVDVSGLESALLNLVVNARDAMPRGGKLTITTRLSELEPHYPPVIAGELPAGRYACVSISDTGTGMKPEVVERVFEPFFSTKPRGKGTGLGLAMVYGFVKQSGGTVRIYSEFGYGTTVSFYLPLAEGVAPEGVRAVSDRLAAVKPGGTVLVVDDEVELLEIAKAYLTELGYTVYQARDGISALEILAQQADIDVMVTDIIMPGGMNGVELAQQVRQMNPAIGIVYSSGFPAEALAERSFPLVDGPVLHKPYQRSELGAILRRTMSATRRKTSAEGTDPERSPRTEREMTA